MGLKVRPLLVPLENPQLYRIMQTPSPPHKCLWCPFYAKVSLTTIFIYRIVAFTP